MIELQAIRTEDGPLVRTGRRLAMTCTLMGLGMMPLGCHRNVAPPHPPVKVQGGTIHGLSDVWTPTGSRGYTATPPSGSDWISTTNFQGNALQKVTNTGGWKIEISNSDGKNEAPKALMLCSDPGCNLTGIGTNSVYLSPGRAGVSLSLDSGGTLLRFHDDAHCDHGTGSEKDACDKIVSIKIITSNAVLSGNKEQTLTCQTPTEPPKNCEIDIGH